MNCCLKTGMEPGFSERTAIAFSHLSSSPGLALNTQSNPSLGYKTRRKPRMLSLYLSSTWGLSQDDTVSTSSHSCLLWHAEVTSACIYTAGKDVLLMPMCQGPAYISECLLRAGNCSSVTGVVSFEWQAWSSAYGASSDSWISHLSTELNWNRNSNYLACSNSLKSSENIHEGLTGCSLLSQNIGIKLLLQYLYFDKLTLI